MARRNSLVGPIIAVFISGGVGAFMFSIVNSEKTIAIPAPKEIIKEAPTVRILVANNNISIGKRLNTNDMSWRAWPESLLNPDYITENQSPNFINDLVGGIAKMPIVSGEPIIEGKIVKADGSRGAMAVLLRKGMRAVSIEVSARTGAGGFILPGDFVDVIITANLLRDDVFKSNQNASKVPPIANYLFMRSLSKQRKDVNETSVSSKENVEIINKKTEKTSEPNSNLDTDMNAVDKNSSKDTKQVKIDDKTSEKLFNLTQDEDKLLDKIGQEDELFVADSSNISEGLLENVKVLAIDQNIDYSKREQGGQDQNAAIIGATATLEVTPEQAKLLAWASNIGKLTLSLRSFGETLSAIDSKILNQQLPKITTNFALPLKKVIESSSMTQTTQGLQIIRSGNISSMKNVPASQNKKIKESQKTSGDTDVKN